MLPFEATRYDPYDFYSLIGCLTANQFETVLESDNGLTGRSYRTKLVVANCSHNMLVVATSMYGDAAFAWVGSCDLFFCALPQSIGIGMSGGLQELPREYGVKRSTLLKSGKSFVHLTGQVFKPINRWPKVATFVQWDNPEGKGLLDIRAGWEQHILVDVAWRQFVGTAPRNLRAMVGAIK